MLGREEGRERGERRDREKGRREDERERDDEREGEKKGEGRERREGRREEERERDDTDTRLEESKKNILSSLVIREGGKQGEGREGGKKEERRKEERLMSLTPLSNSISLNCLCRSSSDFPALSCTAFFSTSATSVNWECTSTMGAPLNLSCKSDDSMDLVSPSPSPSESESLLGLFAAGSVFISPVRSARGKKMDNFLLPVTA